MGNIIRLSLEDKGSAIALFKTIINQGSGYREAMSIVATQPQAALAALQSIDAELSPQGAAKILEEVVSNAPDNASATKLVDEHLSKARQAELLAARSDLDSVAADIVSLDVVLQAMRKDLGENIEFDEYEGEDTETKPNSTPTPSQAGVLKQEDDEYEGVADRTKVLRATYVARSWARKLRDRADYQEILGARLVGQMTFLECLLIGLANDALRELNAFDEDAPDHHDAPMDQSMFGGLAEEENLISDEALEALGLDPDEAMDGLRELLENKRMLRFRQQEIAAVQAEREDKRQTAEKATAEAARDAAAQAADKVDF